MKNFLSASGCITFVLAIVTLMINLALVIINSPLAIITSCVGLGTLVVSISLLIASTFIKETNPEKEVKISNDYKKCTGCGLPNYLCACHDGYF